MPPLHEDVVEHAPMGVAVCDPDGTIRALNRKADRLFRSQDERGREAAPGLGWREAFPHLLDTPFASAFDEVSEAEPGATLDLSLVLAGTAWRVRLRRLDEGVAVYLLDGEERGRAPAKPESARTRMEDDARSFRTFQRTYPFGSISLFGPELRHESVSGRGWAELGIDPRSLEGKSFDEAWDPQTAHHLRELAEVALAGYEASARFTHEGRTHVVWAGPLPDLDGTPRGMFLSRDVTEEESRGERVALLEEATDAAEMGIVLVDVEGHDQPIVYASAGFERLTGYRAEEARGRNCRFLQGEATDPVTVQDIREAVERREPLQATLLNYRKDGTPFWNRLSLTPFGPPNREPTHYIGVQEDVTEIREAQVERNHQRRLAELGTLAGSVAHDFNNILMEIQGRVALAGETGAGAAVEEELQGIAAATASGRQLVEHLLAYARRNAPEEGPLGGTARVSDVIGAITRFLPGSVQVRFFEPDEEVLLPLDLTRLEQVLLNLAKNASEAMPGGGTLTVRIEADAEAGRAVLTVADDGIGMSEEVLEHVFEPFYTTKGPGGTGLGLSSVRRIVERVGGSVSVESEEGRGTTFILVMPVATGTREEPEEGRRPGGPRTPPAARGLAGLRLLLVEDQEGVRNVLQRLLERRGMEVIPAADGTAALELYREARVPFDIVLTDWDMPGMGGDRLLHEIDALHPGGDRPWLALMSGDMGGAQDLPPGTIPIPKPFEVDELMDTLRRALAPGSEEIA